MDRLTQIFKLSVEIRDCSETPAVVAVILCQWQESAETTSADTLVSCHGTVRGLMSQKCTDVLHRLDKNVADEKLPLV